MQKKILLLLLATIFSLTACGKASAPSPAPLPPSSSAVEADPDYPFYSDADFVEAAYAMGYSDQLLKLCWENGHTKESILHPPVSFVYDVSPDERWTLYQGATPSGGMLLGLEQVCLQNSDTGETIVLGAALTGQRVLHANVSFCADDRVSFLDTYGGAVYDLEGREVLSVTLDPEAAGWYIYEPVYHPGTNSIVGLGVSYKEGNTPEEADRGIKRTFAFFSADPAGKIISAAITDIPLEWNKYRQIITPTAALVRGDSLWIALTALDGQYPFYCINLADSQAQRVESAEFRDQFPHYDKKG